MTNKHERFSFRSLDEVKSASGMLGVSIPLDEDVSVLKQTLEIKGNTIQNRIAIQPMEGCDGKADGTPDELTLRRYDRFAKSGAGIIWAEAVAVAEEGRANPRQLMITEKNLDVFKKMVDDMRNTAQKETNVAPVIIMQATHSGRYSKPYGKLAPLIAYKNKTMEEKAPISDSAIVSDDYLRSLAEKYEKSAKLAMEAGFDGIDIKACHRYLLSELLSAYTRPGDFGGSFENRTRLYRDAVAGANAAAKNNFFVTSRLNVYDALPYPDGFGVDKNGGVTPSLDEAARLVKWLHDDYAVEMIDVTIGNPYFNPHINRPFDMGAYTPDENPLVGVARMCDCISQIKKAVPKMTIMASGFSYLRQFGANQAAGMISGGHADIAGFGRQAFAYPTFASDILKNGEMDSRKVCISCSKCTELMRAGSTAGCVIKDREKYMPIYVRDVVNNPDDVRKKVSN